jgi:hypothetical protein
LSVDLSFGRCARIGGEVLSILADDPDHLPVRSNYYPWRLDADPTNIVFTPASTGPERYSAPDPLIRKPIKIPNHNISKISPSFLHDKALKKRKKQKGMIP